MARPGAVLILVILLFVTLILQQEVQRRIAAKLPVGRPGWIATFLGFAAMVGAIQLGVSAP